MTLKKDELVPYEGVLIPELNYRNYKWFEKVQPEIFKTIEHNPLPLTCPNEDHGWIHAAMWATIGASLALVLTHN